jgi:hypothetical protein
MAVHTLRITQMPEVMILKKDLSITIDSDGEVLGTLTISQGGIGWFPSGPSNERHLVWEAFDRATDDWPRKT